MDCKQNNINQQSFLSIVFETIARYEMFSGNCSVLLGVSGGPDSTALAAALVMLSSRLNLKLGIAHLNHCLRGKDAESDAEFVRKMAASLGLPFFGGREDVLSFKIKKGISLEEAARIKRYGFLMSVAEENSFSHIALGHNSDDNAELILMNLLRGSGPLGLSGIPAKRDKIVRPLIKLSREKIMEFLREKRMPFVVDKSNDDQKFLRNRIRHELIPFLRKSYNPRIVDTINKLGCIMADEEKFGREAVEPIFRTNVEKRKDGLVKIYMPGIRDLSMAAKRRIIRAAIKEVKSDLRRITFDHVEQVILLMEEGGDGSSINLPQGISVVKTKDHLRVSRERAFDLKGRPPVIVKASLSYEYPVLNSEFNQVTIKINEIRAFLRLSVLDKTMQADAILNSRPNTVFFDMDSLELPIILRSIRPGDRFRPLGMTGTQKVKKYFINNKIPKSIRCVSPVLVSGEKIIWLVGHRIDDSVKITKTTQKIIRAELIACKMDKND